MNKGDRPGVRGAEPGHSPNQLVNSFPLRDNLGEDQEPHPAGRTDPADRFHPFQLARPKHKP
jgi:hypothetical protein